MPALAQHVTASVYKKNGAIVPGHYRIGMQYQGKRYRAVIQADSLWDATYKASPWRERVLRELAYPTKTKAKVLTLQAFYDSERLQSSWLAEKEVSYANKIRETFRLWLLPRFGKLALSRIQEPQIADLTTALRKVRANKSVNDCLDILRRALNLAQKWKQLDSVPTFDRLDVGRSDPKFLELAELEKLLTAAQKKSHEHYCLVLCGVDTGTRSGEQIALSWRDVGETDLTIRHSIVDGDLAKGLTTPKSGHTRHVPLSVELRDALVQLRGEKLAKGQACGPDDRIFANIGKWSLTKTKQLYKWIQRIANGKDCQVQTSRHQLRHSYASHLISNGATLYEIQTWLGQQSPAMAQRYAYIVSRREMGVSVGAMAMRSQPA